MVGEWLPRAVGALVLFHGLERLWPAAHRFNAEGSRETAAFVSLRLTMLLEQKLGHVIDGLRRLCDRHTIKGENLDRLNAAIPYYENYLEHMKYDEYLAARYPIRSSGPEGTCHHLVKDRMRELAAVGRAGSPAAVDLNGRWDGFSEYRAETEQDGPYGKAAAYRCASYHQFSECRNHDGTV